ncbi:MAG: hypothetical protein K1X79_06855 [Oligoflexia bacterium]|nr:hypothetical protein [Oligoflexia bacterium]
MRDLILRWLATALTLKNREELPRFRLSFVDTSQPQLRLILILEEQPRLEEGAKEACDAEVVMSPEAWRELESGRSGPQELWARGHLYWNGSADAVMAWSYLAFLTKEMRFPQNFAISTNSA